MEGEDRIALATITGEDFKRKGNKGGKKKGHPERTMGQFAQSGLGCLFYPGSKGYEKSGRKQS